MPEGLLVVIGVAGLAAVASVGGGLIAYWHRSSTLVASLAFGFAGGALAGTVTLEMLPTALDLGALATVVIGFAAGMIGLYLLDLYVHRGWIVGEHADQRRIVRRYRRRQRAGAEVVVLAGGTSAEELIEGLVIGVGAAIEPTFAVIVALAIAVDNLSEGMAVGELIRDETPDRTQALRRILKWTGTIGLALFASSLIGWLLLRGVAGPVLGPLLAAGAGAMFYLTLHTLVPAGEAREFQGSATLASGLAFTVILVLSALGG
jgi:ZIP family zinc transporter